MLFGGVQLGPPAGRAAGVRGGATYYQRCLELPHPVAGQVGVAVCLKTLGKGDEARRLLEEAAAADQPTRVASYRAVGEVVDRLLDATELGTLYSELGEHAKAEPWLRKAVEYNPRDLVARFGLAVAWRGLGHLEEAQQQSTIVQTARKAIEDAFPLYQRVGLHPDDVQSRFKLGRILLDYESERMGLFYLRTVLTYKRTMNRRVACWRNTRTSRRRSGWRLSAERQVCRVSSQRIRSRPNPGSQRAVRGARAGRAGERPAAAAICRGDSGVGVRFHLSQRTRSRRECLCRSGRRRRGGPGLRPRRVARSVPTGWRAPCE